MQRWPLPHWVTAQVSWRHWPVSWSQNWPPGQGMVAQLLVMQAPPTQRCELGHLLTVHRSTQLPLSQYWLPPQLTPTHLSVWHIPALHIWPAAAERVAVDTLAVLADSRRVAHHARAQRRRTSRCSRRSAGRWGRSCPRTAAARSSRPRTCSRWGRGTRRACTGWCSGPPCNRGPTGTSVLVGHAVAVVVRAVADLGAGQHAAFAHEAARAAADQVARLARADADLGRVQARADAGLAGLREVAVVDHAVAVVVEAVAHLGHRCSLSRCRRSCRSRTGDAGVAGAQRRPQVDAHARAACRRRSCRCSCRRCRCRPRATACAGASQTRRCRVRCTATTPPRQAGAHDAVVARPCRPLKPSSMSPLQLSSMPLHSSGGTGQPADVAAGVQRAALVDRAVAVVVLAVARLDGAVLGRRPQQVVGVVRVVGCGRRARVAARPRRSAVAVVVLAVADLGRRHGLGDDVEQRRLTALVSVSVT